MLSWLLIGSLTAVGLVYFDRLLNQDGNRIFTFFSTTLISVAIVVLVATNFKLLFVARKHFQDIKKTLVREKKSIIKRNSKATFTCIVMVASFIVLWSPQLVHNILSLIGIYRAGNDKLPTQIVWLIAMIDSIVNPFIHMCFNRGIRQFVKRISLRKPLGESKQFNTTSINNHSHRIKSRCT